MNLNQGLLRMLTKPQTSPSITVLQCFAKALQHLLYTDYTGFCVYLNSRWWNHVLPTLRLKNSDQFTALGLPLAMELLCMSVWIHLHFQAWGAKKKNYACFLRSRGTGSESQSTLKILKGAYAEWGRAPVSVINTPRICAGFSKAVFFRSRTEKTSLHAHNSLPLNYQH